MDIKRGYNLFHILLLVIGIDIGAFFIGYNVSVFNIAYQYIAKINNWDKDQSIHYYGVIASFFQVGQIVISPFSGIFIDFFGRLNTLLIANIVGILGTSLILVKGLTCLLLGRIICGISGGILMTLCPLYIREITPVNISGSFGTIYGLFIKFGAICSYAFAFGFPNLNDPEIDWANTNYWRIVLGFPIILLLCQIFLLKCWLNFESPRKLYVLAKYDESKRNLLYIYGNANKVEEEFMVIKNDVNQAS